MATEKKKVVKSSAAVPEAKTSSKTKGATWAPTPEAKRKAVTFRWIAAVLWALAIAGEAYAIFGVLANAPVNMTLLIVLIVVIGALAIVGNLLWRKANQLDPASEKDKFRFWVQNQLGAIITMIAFLPLVVLILVNKDMDPKQKTIATVIAAIVAIPAFITGAELNSNSVEQMSAEQQQIIAITGVDEVFWTKSGKVYHLCQDAHYVNIDSADGEITKGSIAQANAEGKRAPAQQTIKTESNQCGFTYVTPEEMRQQLLDDTDDVTDDATDDEVEDTESEG